MSSWMDVKHKPVWVPTQLRYNYEGDTKPGFECVHPLENGNGPCGSNVFELEESIEYHRCIVIKKKWRKVNPKRRMRIMYHQRRK